MTTWQDTVIYDLNVTLPKQAQLSYNKGKEDGLAELELLTFNAQFEGAADERAKLVAEGWKSGEQVNAQLKAWLAEFIAAIKDKDNLLPGRAGKIEGKILDAVREQARADERQATQQEVINALNDYTLGKISLERCAERMNMNVYELIAAMRKYVTLS